jgi:hypothetical protein
MKMSCRRAGIMSAAVLSMFVIVGTVRAAEASDGGPNDAYCLDDEDGSPWCGYATYSQCRESASGTGRECVANVFGGQDRRVSGHSFIVR